MDKIKFEFVDRVKKMKGFGAENGWSHLPERGTKWAAGYDFYNPETITIEPHEIKIIKTGIKAYFPENMALLLLNRSSNPTKKHIILANGIGLIDADYVDNVNNEGEIGFQFMNISDETITIERNEKLGQGMFVEYSKTFNDDTDCERIGGFGSTGK